MKPKIVIVREAPKLINPIIQSGFRHIEDVRTWAEHNNYAVVYYFEKKQRVYVDRAAALLNQARQLQRSTAKLLKEAQALGESMT